MNSDKLPVTMTGPERRNGADMPGVSEGARDGIGDGTEKTVAVGTPRRTAHYGGTGGKSIMQEMIGGPYGGRTGNAASKEARVNKLPA